MVLHGEKILLRALQPADADILHTWENDKTHWDVSGTRKPFSKKEIEDFIANQKDIYLDKQLRWMVCLPQESQSGNESESGSGSVGCIDLFGFDGRQAGIGILIAKEHRNNGYASDALKLLIRYSFEILHLRQLHCSVSKENAPSMKLFLKYRFQPAEQKSEIHHLRLTNMLS